MTDTALARPNAGENLLEQVVIQGNLAGLTPAQRANYYAEVCTSVGLNPLTRPFEYLTLNGKLILYARKDATDQLRSLRKVSLTIVSREIVSDLYVVTARAVLPDGRTDEEIGAVPIKGLGGEGLANAMMKASTKAKRRVTLSICGMGLLDETELETIPPGAQRAFVEEPAPRVSPSVTAGNDPHRAPDLMEGAVTGAVPVDDIDALKQDELLAVSLATEQQIIDAGLVPMPMPNPRTLRTMREWLRDARSVLDEQAALQPALLETPAPTTYDERQPARR